MAAVDAFETDDRLTDMGGDGLETHALAGHEFDSASAEESSLGGRDFGWVSVSYNNSR